MSRPICKIKSCNRVADYKCTVNGKRYYKSLCASHRRPMRSTKENKSIDISVCSKCGSHENCQRHRTGLFGRLYIAKNVQVLCQECHIEVHNILRDRL